MTTTRPLLLDLYCGGGGAAVGYHRAGFDVLGVDIRPQPRYPYEFVQADALTLLADLLDGWPTSGFASGYVLGDFAAIHASPPCQRFTALAGLTGNAHDHPDLLTPTLTLLAGVSIPWVVENVPGAPLRPDLVLCGEMFGLRVRRHRWFQTSPMLYQLVPPCRHDTHPVGVYGHPGGSAGSPYRRSRGDMSYSIRASLPTWRAAMGIDWMSAAELAQAIPPAYTQHLGELLLTAMATTP